VATEFVEKRKLKRSVLQKMAPEVFALVFLEHPGMTQLEV
jgi:hypothetical protein